MDTPTNRQPVLFLDHNFKYLSICERHPYEFAESDWKYNRVCHISSSLSTAAYLVFFHVINNQFFFLLFFCSNFCKKAIICLLRSFYLPQILMSVPRTMVDVTTDVPIYQGVTTVPVKVDMNWILMDEHAQVHFLIIGTCVCVCLCVCALVCARVCVR